MNRVGLRDENQEAIMNQEAKSAIVEMGGVGLGFSEETSEPDRIELGMPEKTPYQHAKEALDMVRQDRDRWYRKSAEVMDECLALRKQIEGLTPKQPHEVYLCGAEIEELQHHYKDGPVHDGDCISKSGRNSLLEQRLLARVVVRGENGYCAVTMIGEQVLKNIYECMELNIND